MDGNELLKHVLDLHQQILDDSKQSLFRAIELGSILKQQKEAIGHGGFIKWVESSLPFSERTSRNYLSLYRHKETIVNENITSLRQAYLLISNHNAYNKEIERKKLQERRFEASEKMTVYDNPESYVNNVICGDNIIVMKDMLKKQMKGNFSAIVTSPPYNSNFNYGRYDDNKPYKAYLDYLLEPFSYYLKLLRTGGRVIYIVPSFVKNDKKKKYGDYNHQLLTDLTYRVREQFPKFKHYSTIIWNKGEKGKNPYNRSWGTYCNPQNPVNRVMHEYILVWSKETFDLENVEGFQPDISEEEFQELSWSVWDIAPTSIQGSPNPCSFAPQLVQKLLRFFTFPNDIILDPYAGAGTTGIVANNNNRRYVCIEQNPNYCHFAQDKLGKIS